MEQHFNKSSCSSSHCSFDNVYQPIPISPSIKFVAMSGWHSTFKDLAPTVSLLPDEDKNYNFTSVNLTQIHSAIETICKESWSHVHKPDEDRPCKFIIL
jgi:hypothetical protein